MAKVTFCAEPVTALPPASSSATTGCVGNATPPVELLGLVVKANCVAVPTVMLKVLLGTFVKPSLLADSLYPVPAVLIERPLKVATPFTALTVVVPLRVPGPPEVGVPVVMASMTEAELFSTVLPFASSTVTTGWVGKATPPVELVGLLVKTNFVAGP